MFGDVARASADFEVEEIGGGELIRGSTGVLDKSKGFPSVLEEKTPRGDRW